MFFNSKEQGLKKILQASIVVMQNLLCRINVLLLVSLSATVIRDLSNKTFPVSCGFFPSYSTVPLYRALSSPLSQVGHFEELCHFP